MHGIRCGLPQNNLFFCDDEAILLRHIPDTSPLHQLPEHFRREIREAQDTEFSVAFSTAHAFISQVVEQLRVAIAIPDEMHDVPVQDLLETRFSEYLSMYKEMLRSSKYPDQSIRRMANSLATRSLLLRAFANPDEAVEKIRNKIVGVVADFPREASDIELGRNKGDVLDPFILAANQYLLYGGEFDGAISSTVSHKALMVIEGLMGHLHEDVLGLMRGNARVPEPRGKDQETFSYETNPFPGADVIQPPFRQGGRLAIHQIKSKTGSAKGGDGKRLGDQLRFLSEHYDADIFYDAVVGNTLIGHRSKTGVEKAAPNVRVLVGEAAFKVLTGSRFGATLLLKVYQESFIAAAELTGYSIADVTERIVARFRAQAEETGGDFLESILHKSTSGRPEMQDSFLFNRRNKRGRRKS